MKSLLGRHAYKTVYLAARLQVSKKVVCDLRLPACHALFVTKYVISVWKKHDQTEQ
jgi:hypothetical protein